MWAVTGFYIYYWPVPTAPLLTQTLQWIQPSKSRQLVLTCPGIVSSSLIKCALKVSSTPKQMCFQHCTKFSLKIFDMQNTTDHLQNSCWLWAQYKEKNLKWAVGFSGQNSDVTDSAGSCAKSFRTLSLHYSVLLCSTPYPSNRVNSDLHRTFDLVLSHVSTPDGALEKPGSSHYATDNSLVSRPTNGGNYGMLQSAKLINSSAIVVAVHDKRQTTEHYRRGARSKELIIQYCSHPKNQSSVSHGE